MSDEVVVVGAGVIGLTAAARLLEHGHRVVNLTATRTPHTCSDRAAAIWLPYGHDEADPRVPGWGRLSLERFAELALNRDTGVSWIDAFELHERPRPEPPWWASFLPLRRPESGELPPGYADAWVTRVPLIEMPRYMPWLERHVVELGGRIEPERVDDLDALASRASCVVNATGLGARELVRDDDVHPIRGQIVVVAPAAAQPLPRRCLVDDTGPHRMAYVIPRADGVVLGGTEVAGDWSEEVDADTERGILERCRGLEPRLDHEDVRRLKGYVGLRPGRSRVRLEAERRPCGLLVVHAYGHAHSGVTLSWGCAEDVARLVR